jgi:hypothetical protein
MSGMYVDFSILRFSYRFIDLTICWHCPLVTLFLYIRTPEEFQKGHCEGALNIPIKISSEEGKMVDNPDFDEQVSTLNFDYQRDVIGGSLESHFFIKKKHVKIQYRSVYLPSYR